MASDDTAQQVSGIEMTAEEIESFLYDQGHGVLSFANGGESYGIPISFGYDGESTYMHLLQFGEESTKMRYLAETDVACLVAYDVETRFEWRSVVARGPLREIGEDEIEGAEETLDDNGWFPTIFPPTDPMTDVSYVEMAIEEATGRKGQAYQD